MNPPILTWKWFFVIFLTNIIASVISGIVSGLWMSLIVWRIQRRTEKLDAFTEVILPILRGIEVAKTPAEVADTYKASIPVVRDAAAKFSLYIRKRNRCAFDATWREYCGIKDDALQPRWDIINYPADLTKILSAPTKLDASKDIVRLLNTLMKLAGVHA